MAEAVDDLFAVFSEDAPKQSRSFSSSSGDLSGVSDEREKEGREEKDEDEKKKQRKKRKTGSLATSSSLPAGDSSEQGETGECSGVQTPHSSSPSSSVTTSDRTPEESDRQTKEDDGEEAEKKKSKRPRKGEGGASSSGREDQRPREEDGQGECGDHEEKTSEHLPMRADGGPLERNNEGPENRVQKEKKNRLLPRQTPTEGAETTTTNNKKRTAREEGEEEQSAAEEAKKKKKIHPASSSSSSPIVVTQLAEDLNCLHEVVSLVDCPTKFLYFHLETTLPEYRPKTPKTSKEDVSREGAKHPAQDETEATHQTTPASSSPPLSLSANGKGAVSRPSSSSSVASSVAPAGNEEAQQKSSRRSTPEEGEDAERKNEEDQQEEEAENEKKKKKRKKTEEEEAGECCAREEEDLSRDTLRRQSSEGEAHDDHREGGGEGRNEAPAPGGVVGAGADRVPARQYKFRLDTFQQRSVLCLEAGESVLVSAHTSAGKTVVAEYAIAMSIRDKQRVVYTSPIKALSNQKYRDLCEIFGSDHVGLMTGDVTLHPTASIMVMTTEILRSMLYRGSQLIHEMKWLIFDEIHYMRDRERGVVWEESIVLVPSTVRFVFLSATIPNAREFAEWIASIKQQPCHVLYTDYRPTPLQHYMFPAGGEGVYLVMDEKKRFREENFHRAVATLHKTVEEQALQSKQNPRRGGGRSRGSQNKNSIERIILMCHARLYTPVIVFCFSKRECETNAMSLLRSSSSGKGPRGKGGGSANGSSASIDLTTEEEKKLIREIFNNALETLEEEDRELPQVKSILPLLERGIGIHHGGLLPFIKEIIEILFQESLLRVLFSTETFSMGVNMPAKTVVFTAIRKFDGLEYRIVNSGEYIQMAGRAGRRGLDDRGIVIIMFDEQVDPEEAKQLFMGQASPLLSTFHLGFNMLLNLFRIEDADPLFMITRSFAHFQRNRQALHLEKEKDELEQKVKEAEGDIHALAVIDDKDRPDFDVDIAVRKYYELKHDLDATRKQLRDLVMQEKYIVRFLQAGRIVQLTEEDGTDWGWSTCVSKISRKFLPSTNAVLEDAVEQLVVHCVVACAVEEHRDVESNNNGKQASPKQKANGNESKNAAGAGGGGGGQKGDDADDNNKPKPSALFLKPRPANIASKLPGTLVENKDYVLKVIPFTLKAIQSISKCRMTIPPGVSVESEDMKKSLYFQLKKVEEKFRDEGGLPLLDPAEDMRISDPQLKELQSRAETLESELKKNPLYGHPLCQVYFNSHEERMAMKTKLRRLQQLIDSQRQLVMKDTLRSMRRVLRELEFVDSNDIVTMKGCVACEITTADELVAAELLFQNVFETLEVEAICAMLSCLVFQEKHDEPEPTDEILLKCLDKVKAVARRIASVCVESRYVNPLLFSSSSSQLSRLKHKKEASLGEDGVAGRREGGDKENRRANQHRGHGVGGGRVGEDESLDAGDFGADLGQEASTTSIEDYVGKFQHAIMTITYRWAKGESFADVISGTCIYEGTVIRSMRRLEELLRQMACASKTIGNSSLEAKFIEGIKKIRRGIVFSSSLYL